MKLNSLYKGQNKTLSQQIKIVLAIILGITISILVIAVTSKAPQHQQSFRFKSIDLMAQVKFEFSSMYHTVAKFLTLEQSNDVQNISMIKPIQDNRKYRYTVLQNGVKALLVQGTSSQAGAILRIHVGSSAEPPRSLQGLAHLIEHIAYNGNPSEKDVTLTDLLAKYDGFNNAMTNDLYTQYYFTVSYDKLFPTMAKWAEAFQDLQFTKEDVKREMKAVNSEYFNTLVSDAWRFQELVRRLSDPDGQFIRCSIGTDESLPVDSEVVDVHKEAKQFVDKYYTPDKMSLVIVGVNSLDELENLAAKQFGLINKKSHDLPHQSVPTFPPKYLGKFSWVKTISHGKAIRLVFPIPKHLKTQDPLINPLNFISFLLESEHEGGFLYSMKGKKYISDFSSRGVWDDAPDVNLFYMTMQLTEKGFENSIDIIESFFHYVKALEEKFEGEGLEDIYNNQSFLSYVNFHYRDKESTSALMQNLIGKMGENKHLEHLILQNRVSMKYDKENFKKNLDLLNIRNALVIYQSRDLDVKVDYKSIRYKDIFTAQKPLFPTSHQSRFIEKISEKILNEEKKEPILSKQQMRFKQQKTRELDVDSKFCKEEGSQLQQQKQDQIRFEQTQQNSVNSPPKNKVQHRKIPQTFLRFTQVNINHEVKNSTTKMNHNITTLEGQRFKQINNNSSADNYILSSFKQQQLTQQKSLNPPKAHKRKIPESWQRFTQINVNQNVTKKQLNNTTENNANSTTMRLKQPNYDNDDSISETFKYISDQEKPQQQPSMKQESNVQIQEPVLKQEGNDLVLQYESNDIQQDNHQMAAMQAKPSGVLSNLLSKKISDEVELKNVHQKTLDTYDEFEQFYFATDNIQNELLNRFDKARQEKLQFKAPKASRFVPQSLNIVSDCKEIDEKSALSRPNRQNYVIQDTDFTKPINQMIKSRANKFYDINCFNQELQADISKEYPTLIKNDTYSEVWMKSQRDRMQPKIQTYVRFNSPNVYKETNDILSFQIMTSMLEKSLELEISEIEQGGSTLDIDESLRGITVMTNGYSDMNKDIILLAIERMKRKQQFITQDYFETAKGNLQMNYKNAQLINSQEQTDMYLNAILRKHYHYPHMMAKAIDTIQFNQVDEFYDRFIQNLSVKCIFMGNIVKDQALSISQEIVEHLKAKNTPQNNELYHEEILKLKNDKVLTFRQLNQDSTDSNHAIYNYYQIGKRSVKKYAILNYIDNQISNDAFAFLRDQEHLGYIANAGLTSMHKVDGLYFFVQGSSKDPTIMDQKIEEFLKKFREKYEQMPASEFPGFYSYGEAATPEDEPDSPNHDDEDQDDFNEQIKNLSAQNSKQKIGQNIFAKEIENMKLKANQQLSLNGMADKFWSQISKNDYDFKSQYKIIRRMYSLTKQDIINFMDDELMKNSKKLSIQIFSQKGTQNLPTQALSSDLQYSKKESIVIVNGEFDRSKYESFTTF